MELTDREQTVVQNVWGEAMPSDLRNLETKELITMHDRVSQAVQVSFDDEDVDSLGILLPLEGKIVKVLQSRI